MEYTNTYIVKAIDAYPYNLEEAVENLNFAYSYDPKNTLVLCLLGRFHAEYLKNYPAAIEYFQMALAENVNAIEVYPHYINVLLWNEDYKEAKKLINFALNVKGSDKAVLRLNKAILFEQQGKYKMALNEIKKAKRHTYNNNFMNTLKDEKTRIKNKIKKK